MLSFGLALSGTTALLSVVAQAAAAVAPAPALAELHTRQSTGTGKCTDVHVFLAKGNNEPYPGRQGKLVSAICEGIPSCDYEDIVMQNMLPDPYCDSVHQGGENTAKQVVAYNKKCPRTKLVLSGYSQGAHALGDGLSGGGGVFFQGCVEQPVTPLNPKSSAGKAVAAILTFGDTRHTASQPANFETGASKNGLFPRPAEQLTKLNAFSDRHRDYCVDTDSICSGADPNGPEASSHLAYFDKFTNDAAMWVKGKLGYAANNGTKPSSGTSGTATATATLPKGTGSSRMPTTSAAAPTRTRASASTRVGGASSASLDPSSDTTLTNAPATTATDAPVHTKDPATPTGAAASPGPNTGAGATLAPLGLFTLAFAAGLAIVMG